MTPLEDNKSIVRRFLKALGSGDVATIKQLMHADIAAICTGTCLLSGTRRFDDIAAAVAMLGSATQAGIDFEILHLTAEGDRVACETQGRSTLVNGTPYNNQYHFLFVLREGKIIQMKEYLDTKLVDAALGPLLQAAA